jgi:dipeptidyl aminopeptidase/acylaminoacyl peptidase
MKIHSRSRVLVLATVASFVAALSAFPIVAQTPAKKPLTYDVYESWRSIAGARLSDDGKWFVYSLTSQADDPELIVRDVQSGREIKHARGTGAQITPDGKFVVFTIAAPRASESETESARGGGAGRGGAQAEGGQQAGNQGTRTSVGIMMLPEGKVTTVEQIASFRLPAESSTWLAMQKGRAGGGGARGGGREGGGRQGGGQAAAGGRQGGGQAAQTGQGAGGGRGAGGQQPQERTKPVGNDLIIRNLATGQDETITEVTDFAWDRTGSWLVYAVSSNDATKDGAFARRMSDGTTRTLLAGKGRYKSFSFDENFTQVLFMSDQAEYDKPVAPWRIYHWKMTEPAAVEIVSAASKGMPAGMVVADVAPRFTENAQSVVISTAPAPAPPPAPNAPRPTPIPVDVWSTRDAQIQPMQRVRVNQEQNRSYRAIVHLSDRRLVQLATKDLPNVNPGDDPNRAIGTSDLPYQQLVSWDRSYNDVYLVDLKTGARRKVFEQFPGTPSISPAGRYLLYFDPRSLHWFTHEIATGVRVNLTERLPVKFYDEGHDTPNDPGSFGTAGWTDADRSLILYDQYDIWEIRPDGTNARNITAGEGRKQQLQYRYRTLETPAPRTIATDKPMLLTTTNLETRATGYYRVPFSGGAPTKIVMMDKAMGALIKAKNADVVAFTASRFDEFGDYWITDMAFTSPKKVTNANPQQSEYVWGKAENIKYINADGKTLNAMLIKPDNFDPTKKYPLMVYIYEELSQGLHGYRAPNVGTSINLTRYVSNGYVVLQPDIIYETGYPGPSAMKCVIPAINTVLAEGYIDPKRIGIQGHSWGGYQITYMITQTNMFAAVQAGASVSNMISAYGGIRWGTGMVRQFQYEKTQSRIGGTLWESPLQFIENSPIFWVERINTPYLSIHNDADDAVPWYQGIEFNMAMRRLGKEAFMFNYNGQGHGLSNRDYMKHWTVHMDEFFDHYLLGKPRPEWMDKGVSYLDRGTRDVSGMFKKQAVTPAANGRNGG